MSTKNWLKRIFPFFLTSIVRELKILKLMVDFAPIVLLPILCLCMLPFNPKDARKMEWGKGSKRRHHRQRDGKNILKFPWQALSSW
jgi:hypothetical protein